MSRVKTVFLLLIIILLGVSLRFYKLDQYPVQLNHDEATQLYDAISIANTGKDIYGNVMPFIFPSIGDYKPPFYTYITSIFYFIFGGGELTIRLPAAIFGCLMIPIVGLFVMSIFKNKKIALLASFFTAIAPFEIFFSRKSFENGAGIFFMLLGFSFLLLHIKQKFGFRWVYLSALTFGVTVYTYFSHAIILPLLISALILIYREVFFKNWKKYLYPLVLFLIIYLPILILTFINPGVSFRAKTVFIRQDLKLGELINESRTGNEFYDFFLSNKTLLDYSIGRYLKQFDPIYIFGNGLDLTNQGLVGMGPLLFIQMPLLFIGIIFILRQLTNSDNRIINKQEIYFIFCWIIIGMIPSGLTFEPFSPHRVIMVFTMLNIMTAVGLFALVRYLYNLNKKFVYPILSLFVLILFINFCYFLHLYFINYPNEKSQNIQYPFKQVAQFMWQNHDNFDQIIFDPLFGEHAPITGVGAHYYIAYFGNYPPAKFQQEYSNGSKYGEMVFNKFSIRKINWLEDKELKNVLIIGSEWSLPIVTMDKSKIIKEFKFYNGKHVAFYAIKL